jgi:hypothetical protein
MILTCPCCGAAASLEAWANDRDWRELIAMLPAIPAQLQTQAISYMGLFRTGKRALKPAKALKILTELKDLIGTGAVHWDGGETRPAPVGLWEQALDAVIERRPNALTNHNYLKKTAWEMAASLAAVAEAGRRKMEDGSAHPSATCPPSSVPRKRGCFTCDHFRPPKGCDLKHKPVGGNLMAGCSGGWTEKVAKVGGLMSELMKNILTTETTESTEEKMEHGA